MAGKGRMKILQRSVEEDLVSGGDKVLQERLGTWEVSKQQLMLVEAVAKMKGVTVSQSVSPGN